MEMNAKELHARAEVQLETYTKKIQIESRVLGDMAMNHILPVAMRYQDMLLGRIEKVQHLFNGKSEKMARYDLKLAEDMADHILQIEELTEKMVEARKVANKISSEREKALAYHDTVAVYFEQIRYHIDKLELVVDNELWPLPKYRELVFIR